LALGCGCWAGGDASGGGGGVEPTSGGQLTRISRRRDDNRTATDATSSYHTGNDVTAAYNHDVRR